jgi:hypothetical protein
MRRRVKQPPNPAHMNNEGPYTAVCGKCNVAINLHPVASCPFLYKPVVLNGRTYGWRMYAKDN